MDTKKDIGQFFNESLNQMDFTPNEDGWNKIENELNEKKKKRRAFFWLFFASFLSGCLLTLLLIYSTNLLEKNTNINKNHNNIETVGNSNKNLNPGDSNNNSNENKLTNEETETKYSKENNLTNGKTETNHLKENNKNSVVSNDDKFEENNLSDKSKQNKTNRNRNNSNSKNYKKDHINYSSNNKFSNTKRKNKSNSKQKSGALAINKKSKQKLDNSTNNNSNSSNLENASASNFDKNLAVENGSKNDSTKIVVTETEVKDTTALASIAKKPLKKTVKLLEKDSTKVEIKNKTNTFILSPYFGYGLLNKNQVTGNFKSENNLKVTNQHYGLLLRWMANKKLGIQIGVGYINASTKTEIEKTDSNNIRFNDVENSPSNTFPPSNKLIMSHNLSLYEIPLEFYYKLNDKKIGFAIASGISHTIIKDNDVFLESSRIGSLQTITNQSFSANLKVYGLYKISDKLQFELYPSFQYQFLNSIKNKDLNPYILSFRAGISYQF